MYDCVNVVFGKEGWTSYKSNADYLKTDCTKSCTVMKHSFMSNGQCDVCVPCTAHAHTYMHTTLVLTELFLIILKHHGSKLQLFICMIFIFIQLKIFFFFATWSHNDWLRWLWWDVIQSSVGLLTGSASLNTAQQYLWLGAVVGTLHPLIWDNSVSETSIWRGSRGIHTLSSSWALR